MGSFNLSDKFAHIQNKQYFQNSVELEKAADGMCVFQVKDSVDKCYFCAPHFYLDSQMKCTKCPQNCQKCLSDRFCIKCEKEYSLFFDDVSRSVLCSISKVKICLNH